MTHNLLQEKLKGSFSKFRKNVAIEDENQVVTYELLEKRTNLVANRILEKGQSKGTLVGVMVEDRVDLIVSILGVVKAGCVFVPLDTSYPDNRLGTMVKDTGIQLMIIDRGSYRRFTEKRIIIKKINYILTRDLVVDDNISLEDYQEPVVDYSKSDPIYIYFTSGTTGKPKGIIGKNEGLTHFINWEIDTFQMNESMRFSQFTNPGFDVFLRDIFVPLCAGATLIIPPEKSMMVEPEELIQWIDENQIQVIHCVPSLFRLFNSNGIRPELFTSLRYIMLAGEKVIPPELKKWYQVFRDRVQVVNLYGPTETTLAKLYYLIQPKDADRENMPVGKHIKGARAIVLDEKMAPCEKLVTGEVYIRTPYRTAGYLNDPSMTVGRFVNNPFSEDPEDVLYRTGDLGRQLPTEEIELLGRVDRQVKIRGIRVELEGMESVLISHLKVKEAVVVKRELENKNVSLSACITKKDKNQDSKVLVEELKILLTTQFTESVVPSDILVTEKIPRTPNGKVNYNEVVKLFMEKKLDYVAPTNDVERKLAEIWLGILKIEKVGITNVFFNLGGNSLNVMTLISKIHKEFNVRIPLGKVFNNPTIKKQAKIIGGSREEKFVSIQKIETKECYDLSFPQKRLYVLHQMEENSINYNMPMYFLLKGEVGKKHVEEIFQKLLDRHESLRTSFEMHLGNPVQMIHEYDGADFEVEYYDIQNEKDLEGKAKEIVDGFMRPFDLSKFPLFRSGLIRAKKDLFVFMFDIHHIVTDGISQVIFSREFMKLYTGKPLPLLRLQYRDFSQWQNKLFGAARLSRQEDYWLRKFEGEIPVLDLPIDFPRPPEQSFEGRYTSFWMGPEQTIKIQSLARSRDVTLYMLMLSFYNIFLSKLTGQEVLLVGTDIAGRRHADLQNLIGMFVNTLVMKNLPLKELNFDEFLQDLKENTLEAFDNQEFPFEEIVRKLELDRDLSRNPLFDVLFTFYNAETSISGLSVEDTPDLQRGYYAYELTTAKFDMTLSVKETHDNINIGFEYCTKLFKRETVQRFADYIYEIIISVLENPVKCISEIEILPEGEKKRILHEFNNTVFEFPENRTVFHYVEEGAEKKPGEIALSLGGEELSYQQLNERANQLARILVKQGMGKDQLAGILLERSFPMVDSILAVWKAGGAYIPIDTDYPTHRITEILHDSGAKVLVTKSSYLNTEMKTGDECEILSLDENPGINKQNAEEIRVENPGPSLDMDSLSYVIYTSGSTGKPKGAMVEHIGMMNHLWAKIRDLNMTEKSVVAQNASHTFDISVWQFFAALCSGGKTVIYPSGIVLEPVEFLDQVIHDEVTILEVVPSYLSMIFDSVELNKRDMSRLEYLLVTGEEVKVDLVEQWFRDYPEVKMVNAYGPTEASDDITHYIMDKAPGLHSVPIGKPLSNLKIYIVDDSRNLCPIGIKGEIFVSGIGVGRGYLGDKGKTDQVFMEDPFTKEKGVRLYKTGDYGKWLPDGSIAFFGRKDYQVKIRGFRIELGEIENAVYRLPGIKDCVVMVVDDTTPQGGESQLCAYLVAETELDLRETKNLLMKQLPGYMVPQHIIQMEQMPLTPNGKTDRKALPHPTELTADEEVSVPKGEVEEQLAGIWAELMGIDKQVVGADSNFFDLGGHSLSAIRMISRIHKQFDVKIMLGDVFRGQTLAAQARIISEGEKNRFSGIQVVAKKEYYHLSSAQKRLYILQQMEVGSVGYNIPTFLVMDWELKKDRLEQAFKKMIQRHESLRTHFNMQEGNPVQFVREELDFAIQYYNLENIGTGASKKEKDIINSFVRPFDLSKAPLFRVGLIRRGPQDYVFMFDMHHIISDGVSEDILTQEVINLYEERDLKPLTIQYKDYAEWQARSLEQSEGGLKSQEDYWLTRFEGEIPVIELPTDYPRPSIQNFEAGNISFGITRENTKALKTIARKEDVTIYMVLLAIFNILLSKTSGQEDIVIGTPTEGRKHLELQALIGVFVNTLALRNFPSPYKAFSEFLKELRENTLNAFDNQDFQFEDLVEKVGVTRNASRNPLFDVMFTLLNMQVKDQKVTQSRVRNYGYESKIAKFDLSLDGIERGDELLFTFEYCCRLFKPATMQRFVNDFKKIVDYVIQGPNIRISDMDLLEEEERTRMLYDFNNTRADFPRGKTIQELFEEQVLKHPESTALRGGFHEEDTSEKTVVSMTYRELSSKSSLLAGKLIEKGVKPGSIVGIMLERSIHMMIGIFGILKSGAAYLPIDPIYPEERISFILEDSGLNTMVTQNTQERGTGKSLAFDGQKVFMDQEDGSAGTGNSTDLPFIPSNNIAYVIYTSGTTGRPKGTLIRHYSIVNRLNWMQKAYPLGTGDTILQKTTFTFDVSVWEIFWWAWAGGTLSLLEPGQEKDPQMILEAVEKHHVTVMHFVPSMLSVFLDYLEDAGNIDFLRSLKQVIASGEVLSVSLVKRFEKLVSQHHHTKLANLYGPTEATIDVSYYNCNFDQEINKIPIGKPIDNIRLFILDKTLKLQPIGVTGELFISGEGLAKGYLNRPELT
jgi:tyrocidine synthetase-3